MQKETSVYPDRLCHACGSGYSFMLDMKEGEDVLAPESHISCYLHSIVFSLVLLQPFQHLPLEQERVGEAFLDTGFSLNHSKMAKVEMPCFCFILSSKQQRK